MKFKLSKKAIANAISTAFTNAKSSVIKNSPEILIGIGIAGMVTGAVLTAVATPKAMEHLEEAENDIPCTCGTCGEEVKPDSMHMAAHIRAFHPELADKLNDPESLMQLYSRRQGLTLAEKFKACWKDYALPAGVIIFSAASIIWSSKISSDRLAILGSSYAMAQKDLADRLIAEKEILDDKTRGEIDGKIVDKQIEERKPKEEDICGTGPTLFYELYSGYMFFSTVSEVNTALKYLADQIQDDGKASLSDFHSYINSTVYDHEPKICEKVGWGNGNSDDHGNISTDINDLYWKDVNIGGKMFHCCILEFFDLPRADCMRNERAMERYQNSRESDWV